MRYILSIVAVLALAGTANAGTNFGLRGGITTGPQQFHVGGHADIGPYFNHVSLRPNIELGFGDDLLIAATNLEAVYRFQREWQTWSPYLGGGVGFNRVDPDNARLEGDASTEVGPLITGGIERGMSGGGRLFMESKLGLGNAPDFKLTVGWTFAR